MDVSFSSFLCAKEKDRMGYGGIPHLPKGQKLRIWKAILSKNHSTLSWYEKEHARGQVPVIRFPRLLDARSTHPRSLVAARPQPRGIPLGVLAWY